MASVTLAESAKLAQNELIAGIIETIIEVNPFFDVLPFMGINGNSLQYTRENAIGAAGVGGVGSSITTDVTNPIDASTGGKAAATFTSVTSGLTSIIADAEVNGLIQATRSSDGNDQRAAQVASKAKQLARIYQHMLVNGTGASNQITGILTLCPAGQKATTGTDGKNLDFEVLDEMIDLVKDKDGQVDYFLFPARTIRSYFALLRALGGASIGDVVTLPSGREVPGYRGIPIFRNDWIPVNQTKGGSSNTTTIFAGTLDEDGSGTQGLSGLTASMASGIAVKEVGEAEDKDETITRLVWYAGLALFSELGISCADGIKN